MSIAKNKLIAEFVGATLSAPNNYDLYSVPLLNEIFEEVESDDENAKHCFSPEEMKFLSSQVWMKPVLDKLKELAKEMRFPSGLIDPIANADKFWHIPYMRNEAALKAIRWYNKNK